MLYNYLDCSLTGQCNSGACHCDAACEGEQCERLAFVPAGNGTDVNSPWALHDLQVSTWGMGTAQRALGDGAQHIWGTKLRDHLLAIEQPGRALDERHPADGPMESDTCATIP